MKWHCDSYRIGTAIPIRMAISPFFFQPFQPVLWYFHPLFRSISCHYHYPSFLLFVRINHCFIKVMLPSDFHARRARIKRYRQADNTVPDFVTFLLEPNTALDYQTFHAEPQSLLSRRDDMCERLRSRSGLRPLEERAESRASVEAASEGRASVEATSERLNF